MRRKFTNLLVLALAFSSAGFVTSCKDTEEDTLAQNKQELITGYTDAIAAQDANLKTLLAAQVQGLQDQIDAINTALAAIKSCTCGDGTLDAHIQQMIDDALANNGDKYMTESEVTAAINAAIAEVIAKLSDAQKAEVQKMIEDYVKANPGLSADDVNKLIKDYLQANPGLTTDDVETIVKAYLATNPQGLTEDQVKTIVTAWIYDHQILNKDQVDALIEAAITKALANYALKSDIPTQAYIESLIDKAINAYAAGDNHLSAAEVDDMIDKAIKAALAGWKEGITETEAELLVAKAIQDALDKYEATHPAGMSAAEVALAINEAVKDLLGKDALNGYPTTAEVNNLITEALKNVKPGMSEAEVKNLVNEIVTEALKGLGNNAGLSQAEVENIVNKIVDEKLKAYTTAAEVSNLINEALKGVDPGMSEAEVENLVNKIVAEAIKGLGNSGLTEAEVKNLVNDIVTERLKNYTTAADVQNAITEALKGALTENDVKALINDAVKEFLADYANTDAVKNLINEAIAKALEGLTTGMTKEEVKNLITEAIKDVLTKDDIDTYLKPYTTTKDVLDLVEDEVEKVLKAYSTTAEVQALIDAAKCACSCLTPEQVAKIASGVLNEWLVAHPYPTSLTKDDVETIAKNVVNDAQVIKELKDAQNALQSTLTGVLQDIAKLQVATEGISTLEKDVNQNKVDIAKLQQAIEDLDLSQYVTYAVLAEKLADIQTAAQLAQSKADLAYDLAKAASDKFDSALEKIAAAQNDYNEKFADVWKALGQTETDLTQKIADKYDAALEKISDVSSKLSEIESQLKSEIADVQKDATKALTLAEANADKIETLDQTLHWVLYKLGLLEGIVDGLAEGQPVDLSTLINEITNLKADVEKMKGDYATKQELAEAVANLTAAYQLADAAQNLVIAGLTAAVAGLQTEILGINTQLGVIEGQILTITGQLGVIEGNLLLLDGKVVTLDGKVGVLEGKVTTLEGKVSTLEGKVALQEGKITTLEGKMTTAEGKITTLEGKVSTLETQLGALDTKVETYKTATDAAIAAVQTNLDNAVSKLDEKISNNKTAIDANTTAINNLTTTVTNIKTAVNNQITGVIVQGTYNPMYGTFNIPAGINSNVLVAFYGKADTPYEFPSSERMYYADPSVTSIAKLTEDDVDMIGSVTGQINGKAGTLISDAKDNAGKDYVTINPAGVDFSKAPVKLVNSQDGESGVVLNNLLPSSKLMTFGYTRSVANGFYAADAYLSKDDISKVAVKIDRAKIANAFKETFETAVSSVKSGDVSGTFPTIATLVGTLYNQFNGILPALAVKADYKNADGETRSVYSNYGVAATAVRAPGFSPEFWNKLEKKLLTDDGKYVNGYYRTMNLIYKINRRVDKYITETLNPRIQDNKIIHFLQNKVANDIAKIDIKPIDADGSFAGKFNVTVYMRAEDDITIGADGTVTINGRSVTTDPAYFTFVEEGGKRYFKLTFQAQIEDLLDQVNYDLNNTKVLVDDISKLVGYVNDYLGNLEYYETRIENKIDNTIQNYLDKVNGKLVNFINNISDRVQPIVLFVEGSKISQLGGSLGAVKKVDASSITLYPTTYTAEVITPCYKKHIAVTNVFKDGTSAQDGDAACKAALQRANQGANMNAVINGGIHQSATLNLADDYIYEVAYSALDYNGQIATRKYYVTKK
ncbi:MAG: hypothetical protein IJT97_07400 [Bacteroidaceae bacterium]|nr:hypothetical protein [Bacteroidaceae bacterium]